jgi:hypothetical protein
VKYFLTQALSTVSAYEAQVELLHEKYQAGGAEFHIRQEGVPLGVIAQDARGFSRALASELERGKYVSSPAHLRLIEVGGKERLIFGFSVTDLVIHGVVARAVLDYCIPKFSPNLYSYLKGRNWWDGVRAFSRFCAEHQAKEKDVKRRGLYVLRRDIAKYTDSIPVGEASPLWPLLRRYLDFPARPSKPDVAAWETLKRVIRPEAYTLDGSGLFTSLTGVPTGSPISTTLFNVYMVELDRELDAMAPDFYIRYGDDLIFADRDPVKARRADEAIRRILRAHWLRGNESKSENLFLNAAGRPSDAWPECKGAPHVNFLGAQISARGQVALGTKKTRGLLNDLNARLERASATLASGLDAEQKGRIFARLVNEALDPDSALSHKSAGLLRHAVTDRGFLKQLDREICLLMLRWVTGSTSIKGFRDTPPIKMRRSWKLRSLYHVRNRPPAAARRDGDKSAPKSAR